MKIFILIVILTNSRYAEVKPIEFNSLETCETAKAVIEDKTDGLDYAFCTAK